MNKIKVDVVMMGPPSSGKGTVAQELQRIMGAKIVSPGDIYRDLREQNTELGRLVRSSLENGGYCPDSLTNRIMMEEFRSKQGSILISDGYPRTNSQLVHMLAHCDVGCFVRTDAPYDKLIYAAQNRIQCSQCGKICNKLRPSDYCACNAEMKTRFDDTPEIYKARYDKYMSSTKPTLDLIAELPNYAQFEVLFHSERMADVVSFVKNHLTELSIA